MKDLESLEQYYQQEKARLQEIEYSCTHSWATVVESCSVKEPYGCKIVGQGSDVGSEPEGYRFVDKLRCKRKCKRCGAVLGEVLLAAGDTFIMMINRLSDTAKIVGIDEHKVDIVFGNAHLQFPLLEFLKTFCAWDSME